jgi:hypothetical protein
MHLTKLIIDSNKSRLFSLARHALNEAIKVIGAGKGDAILIPEYICRDIIASFRKSNVEVLYYKVDLSLIPLDPPDKWPRAKVVLAVNYFGFPQNLNPFNIYSKLTGAVIIEDNAHGYLSKDSAGEWLGLRTQIGVFSLRKTFCLLDGAALVVNEEILQPNLVNQLPYSGQGFSKMIELKSKIKQLPIIGIYLLRFLLFLRRSIRKIRTGYSLPISVDMDQYVIPYQPNPFKSLLSRLEGIAKCEDKEVARRRALYRKISYMIDPHNMSPIFTELPKGVAPYGFPFRASKFNAIIFRNRIKSLGLDIVKWPDLPNGISSQKHYTNVWVVNFL